MLMILRDFLLIGSIVATALWYVVVELRFNSYLTYPQVCLQSSAIITTVTFNACGFTCRMGICL